jgi:hypothetical protein
MPRKAHGDYESRYGKENIDADESAREQGAKVGEHHGQYSNSPEELNITSDRLLHRDRPRSQLIRKINGTT